MSMLTATDRAKMNDNVQWFQQLREKNQKDLSQNYFEILYGTASWLVDQLESVLVDPGVPERCRLLAESHFDLDRGVEGLLEIYELVGRKR
ncbi:MAG TPA: hypothetical protein QF517_07540 [Pseudomonadales bacterium]|nr:hypothetical protein [Pseudomonadales bacterium]